MARKVASGAGKRLVLTYLLGPKSIVGKKNNEGKLIPGVSCRLYNSVALSEDVPSSILMFPAKDAKLDYHDNFDGYTNQKLYEHRFVPAWKEEFPETDEFVLVPRIFEDTASYNQTNHPDVPRFKGKNSSKKHLVQAMKKYKIKSIVVDRGGEEFKFDVEDCARRGSKTVGKEAPTKPELAFAIWSWFRENRPKMLIDPCDLAIHSIGGSRVPMAPYCYRWMAAEKSHAHTKNYVAARYKIKRSVAQLRKDFEDGLHGGKHHDGREHIGITEKSIKGWTKFCVNAMLEDMQKLQIPREKDDPKESKFLDDYEDFLLLWKKRQNSDGTLPAKYDIRTLFLRNPFGDKVPVKLDEQGNVIML